jgi:hypothetical protein
MQFLELAKINIILKFSEFNVVMSISGSSNCTRIYHIVVSYSWHCMLYFKWFIYMYCKIPFNIWSLSLKMLIL